MHKSKPRRDTNKIQENLEKKNLRLTKNKNILDESPWQIDEFLDFAISVSTALNEIHKKDNIYGEIRPGNIKWEPKKLKAVIIDPSNGDSEISIFASERLPYISPEQTGRMNRKIDYHTDFYSLGVTFYQLLTGMPPFVSDDPLEMIHSHIAKTPIPPHELRPEIPEQISAIVFHLLEKNAEERYNSASGLQHDLQKCADQLRKNGQIKPFKLGEADFTGVFQIPQKLYGREEEIKILLDSFDRISSGATELMLVAGYSGIGKTALVHEVQKPLAQKRGYFIEGKFDLYQRNVPYFAWGQAFGLLMNQLLAKSEGQLNTWKTNILEAVGPNGKVLIDIIPNLEKIIGPQPAVPELGGQEAQNRFNIVFQNFIKVIARKEHPMVIFLDDLQWADAASLSFLSILLTDPDLAHFLIIGAYRDNEVDEAHPLTMSITKLRQSQVNIESIILKNISKKDINTLCANSLHCSLSESGALSRLVYSKTAGNPFFTHQILHTLDAEKMLAFDTGNGRWQWDIDALKAMDITDNVIEFMSGRLLRLPPATQEVLKLAACIGNQFELQVLTIIAQNSIDAINSDLKTALKTGVIFKLDKGYKFAHDRVQQAAYELIPESDKKSIHLKIGRLLQQNLLVQEQEERSFDIVNQLNLGANLISPGLERTQLAGLNLKTGMKAKVSSAYSDAKQYVEIGLDLLGPDSWQEHYALTLALHNEKGELASLTGQFDQVSTTMDLIRANAKSIHDQVQIYMTRIEAETIQYNLLPALNIGLVVLKDLGIDIPEQPNAEYLNGLKDKFATLFASRTMKYWGELSEMSDENALAASFILASEMSTSYIANPPLFPIISLHGAILTLEFGLNAWSPFFFGAVAMLTVAWIDKETPADTAIGEIKFIKQTRDITTEMLKNPVTARSRTKALLMLAFISPWVEPLENGIALTQDTYNSGYENGDLLYGAYGAQHFTMQAFAAGLNLEVYQSKVTDYIAGLQKIGNEMVTQWLLIYLQTVQNFREVTTEPYKLKGTYLDEDELLPSALAVKDTTGLGKLAITKLMLSYHFDKDDLLGETIYQAVKFHIGGIASFTIPQFYLYFSLAKLRIIGISNSEDHTESMNLVNSYLELVGIWSQTAPTTFQHKYDLIAAEKARVSGDTDKALNHYEQAISGARENGFIHEEALANELYGRFWIERDNVRFAAPLLDEAHKLYCKWGAMAKAEHLYKRYPEWITEADVATADKDKTSMKDISKNLDLHTILKASQELAMEIGLQPLLTKLMDIVIENAGAQKGFLIMENEGKWLIEAEGNVTKNEVTVLQSVNIDTSDSISAAIVNYVEHTGKNVVLKDAAHDGDFTGDPDIQQQQSKSILCTPLINQTKVVGVLYLENNLTIGAFTPERMELLNLLSSQMAISLENARIYGNLEASEEKFKGVFESMTDVFSRSDMDGKCTMISPSIHRILGYPAEEIVGRNLSDYYTDQAHRGQIVEQLLKTKSIDNFEIDLIAKNGDIVTVSSNSRIIFNTEGEPQGIESSFRDVTEQKKVEEGLVLSEKRKSLLIHDIGERLKELTCLYSISNSIKNRETLEEVFQDTVDAIPPGWHYPEITRGKLRFNNQEWVSEPFEETAWRLSSNIIIDGQKRGTVEVYYMEENPILDEGPFMKEERNLINSITETLTEAIMRKQIENKLQESEERFRGTFEQAAVGIAHVSPDGKFLRINKEFCEIVGYSQDEMLTSNFQNITHPDDLETDLAHVKDLLNGESESYFIEKRYIRKDGNFVWVTLTVSLLRKETSEPDYFISVVEDITDKKNTELKIIENQRHLRDLARDLTISEETVRKRLAIDLHDNVGQLLASSRMQLAKVIDLEENPELAIRAKNISQALLKSIQATRTVIFNLSPPQLSEIGLYGAVHDWMQEHIEKKYDINTSITGENERINLDDDTRLLIFRSIRELIMNVLKHAGANQLIVDFKRKGEMLEITVEDNGVGFNYSSDLLRLKSDGYGLFSIQERLFDLGGSFTVDSVINKGTKATISLPIKGKI